MTLPGTYERCMSGHYYAVVRGDEECSACKQLEAAKLREAELQQAHCEVTKRAVHMGLERDAARNALEIARAELKSVAKVQDSTGKSASRILLKIAGIPYR